MNELSHMQKKQKTSRVTHTRDEHIISHVRMTIESCHTNKSCPWRTVSLTISMYACIQSANAHASLIHVTCWIHIYDMPISYVWCDSIICVELAQQTHCNALQHVAAVATNTIRLCRAPVFENVFIAYVNVLTSYAIFFGFKIFACGRLTCVYSCVCVCIFMRVCVYSCMWVSIFMCVCVYIHVCVCLYSCVCVCIFMMQRSNRLADWHRGGGGSRWREAGEWRRGDVGGALPWFVSPDFEVCCNVL